MKNEQLLKKLPPFQGKVQEVAKKQSVKRIMGEIVRAHYDYVDHYDRIAEYFMTGSEAGVPEALFDFCKQNLHYKVEDEMTQTVRSPAAILVIDKMRGVDCKHYASFIGGVLDAINRTGKMWFDWCYRFASYDSRDSVPEHVFVVVFNPEDEVWIDPVLTSFNSRSPMPEYMGDQNIEEMPLLRISGIGGRFGFEDRQIAKRTKNGCCETLGATGSQVGKTLYNLVPIVDDVPVIGTIAGYVLEAAALVADIFGNKYSQSSDVRWLTQFYEYHVKAENITSDSKVNASDCAPAQLWFSTVLGVAVYDQVTFHNLQGTSISGDNLLNNTQRARITAYKAQFATTPNFIAGLTDAMILQAVQIAGGMNLRGTPGDWAGMVAAPQVDPAATVVDNPDGTSSIVNPSPVSAVGNSISQFVNAFPGLAAIIGIGIVGVVGTTIYLVSRHNKKRRRAA
jgi:hypothetical protein